MALDTSIPTPPPLLVFLFLAIHLYPLMLYPSLFWNIVSVIRATFIFSAVSSDSRLLILPFAPLMLIVAIFRSLFFLIRLRLFFVLGSSSAFRSFLLLFCLPTFHVGSTAVGQVLSTPAFSFCLVFVVVGFSCWLFSLPTCVVGSTATLQVGSTPALFLLFVLLVSVVQVFSTPVFSRSLVK